MDYQDIIHIIEGKRRFGNLPGVEASRKLLAAVGNPQKGLVFIDIAILQGQMEKVLLLLFYMRF